MASPIDIERNGPANEVNTSGFWEINSKFGGTLDDSASLVKKLGSSFGVWIGPRGGYNYYGTLANIISAAGNGSAAGGSIDVSDTRYIKNYEAFAIDLMERYGVSYWKWDGFADDAQFGAFRSGDDVVGYDEAHQHMYGGPNGYFHMTDLWEKWTLLLSHVQQRARELELPNFWVSLTCYVNPSPWHLQFANSVWMQCSADRGERYNAGELTDKMNAMLTYRDGVYYDFIKNHQFQFPLANIYNHDPIYGKEDTGISASSMDGEQFRNYLFMQGTRGTAFWELYYSDSIFDDEKYLVNADFLAWEEENFDMLRNAKVIGGTPAVTATLDGSSGLGGPASARTGEQSAYGFACFNAAGDEGIVSMRNPAATERTIRFRLDAAVGATASGAYRVALDHGYAERGDELTARPASISRGDEVSMTLKPGETQIWHLSQDGDSAAPKLARLYQQDGTTLRVQASEHVFDASFKVTVDGAPVEVEGITPYADLRTFDLVLAEAPANGARVAVAAASGADASGNELTGTVERTVRDGGVVMRSGEGSCPDVAGDGIEGLNGFTATATATWSGQATTLISQGEEWSLGLTAEGRAVFTVKGVSVVSDEAVPATASITGVRENNGMLKVYVNGEIANSAYDAEQPLRSVSAAPINLAADAGISRATVYDRALGFDEVPVSPLADLMAEVEGLRAKVTRASWSESSAEDALAAAREALNGDAAAQQAALKALEAARAALVPGTDNVATENLALGVDPSAGWLPGSTTDAGLVIDGGGSPLTRTTDGQKDGRDSYGIFGNDDTPQPAYEQIDLGGPAAIESVKLWRYWGASRMYGSTALVVSDTADFAQKTVLYYSGDTDVFNLGEQPTESTYRESADGRVIFETTEPTTARYVRLYMNGYEGGVGKENHVIEIEVMGKRVTALDDPYRLDDLRALAAKAEKLLAGRDGYTEESVSGLERALGAVNDLIARIEGEAAKGAYTVTFGAVESASRALSEAICSLETRPEATEFEVTFDYGFDGLTETAQVVEGGTLSEPDAPVRAGYRFLGWFAAGSDTAFDFSSPISSDMTLTAAWELEQGAGPGGEEPGGETPGGENPGGEEPGKEEPGSEEPGAEQPGAEQPDKTPTDGGAAPGGKTDAGGKDQQPGTTAPKSAGEKGAGAKAPLPRTGDPAALAALAASGSLAALGAAWASRRRR